VFSLTMPDLGRPVDEDVYGVIFRLEAVLSVGPAESDGPLSL